MEASFSNELHGDVVLGQTKNAAQTRGTPSSTSSSNFSLLSVSQTYKTENVPVVLSRCIGAFGRAANGILPRFVRPGGLQRKRPLHNTAYLDALRGLAAAVVVNGHCFFSFRGLGLGSGWFPNSVLFRPFRSGLGMVCIFFVISGYVLSYKMLKLMRNQQPKEFLDTLASTTFRRHFRLYAACAFGTFCTMILLYNDVIHSPRLQKESVISQLIHWANDIISLANPFAPVQGRWPSRTSEYITYLWTIPVEFRGSLIVFGFCAATCKMGTRQRMILCTTIILFSYWWDAMDASLFLTGLLNADISLSRHPERYLPMSSLPSHPDLEKKSPHKSILKRALHWMALIVGIYLVTEHYEDDTWPWPLLKVLVPNHLQKAANDFWYAIGASILIWTIDSYRPFQIPLEWDFPQYLGDLSFGLYICHFAIFGGLYPSYLRPLQLKLLGEGMWSSVPTFIITHVLVLWAADLFTRVDSRLVGLGRSLERKLFTY